MEENRQLQEQLGEQERLMQEREERQNLELVRAQDQAKTEKERRLDYEKRLRVVANQACSNK